MKFGKIAVTVASLAVFSTLSAQAATFQAPFFTGTNGFPGSFTDANGGIWQAFRNANTSGDYSTLVAATWDSSNNFWGLAHVNYQSGPTLFSSGDQFNSVLTFETQVAGIFSMDGTAIVDETGTAGSGNRIEVRKFGAGATGANSLLASWYTGAVDSNWDLGAEASLQSISLAAGERIAIFARKIGLDGQVEVTLDGGDPVIITGPAIPEPATLGLLSMSLVALAGRRRVRP